MGISGVLSNALTGCHAAERNLDAFRDKAARPFYGLNRTGGQIAAYRHSTSQEGDDQYSPLRSPSENDCLCRNPPFANRQPVLRPRHKFQSRGRPVQDPILE